MCFIRVHLCAGETFNDGENFGRAKHDWGKTFRWFRNGNHRHLRMDARVGTDRLCIMTPDIVGWQNKIAQWISPICLKTGGVG